MDPHLRSIKFHDFVLRCTGDDFVAQCNELNIFLMWLTYTSFYIFHTQSRGYESFAKTHKYEIKGESITLHSVWAAGHVKSDTKISISGMCSATIQNSITEGGLSGGIAVLLHKGFPPDCGTCFLAQFDQSLFTQPEQPGMSKATYVVTFPVRTF